MRDEDAVGDDAYMFGPMVSHVTMGTRDLDDACAVLTGYGLLGQRYPGGACFPVGAMQYIEVQQADPHGRPLQQWLDSIVDDAHRWCAWSIAVPALDFAAQAGMTVTAVDQTGAGAGFAPWSFEIAGGDRMRSSRGVAPYFIRYGHDAARHAELLRSRVGGELHKGAQGFARVLVGDPEGMLDQWLACVDGPPLGVGVERETNGGVVAVAIEIANDVVPIEF